MKTDSLGVVLTLLVIVILIGLPLLFLLISRKGKKPPIELKEDENSVQILSATICNLALNAVNEIKAKKFTKAKLSARDDGRLLYEFLTLFLHYCDRIAFTTLGESRRSHVVDLLVESVSSQLFNFFSPASQRELKEFLEKSVNEKVDATLLKFKARQDFIALFNYRQGEYGQYKLAEVGEEVLAGTLVWEFSRQVAEFLKENPDNIEVTTRIYIIAGVALGNINELWSKMGDRT